ncbi:MAG TPA: PH domain-containing protein [Candidatus Saccharimonadales bacterium]|nr:PH domain-containing protein [Candidatus Saccharimonadales bacterium]
MISLTQVEQQLKKVGCYFRFWGRGEIRELANVLTPDEHVAHCANGRYEGGFAMLVVTDQRLLLIDHKPMFVAVEDIRFDMIAEIDYSAQLMISTVKVITPSRTLHFSSWSSYHLREVLNYTQQRMLELRQHYGLMQPIQQAATQPAQSTVASYDDMGVLIGGLALQTGGLQRPILMPFNPYNKMPVLQRRRRYPRFY